MFLVRQVPTLFVIQTNIIVGTVLAHVISLVDWPKHVQSFFFFLFRSCKTCGAVLVTPLCQRSHGVLDP